LKQAKIPWGWTLETFPFERQPTVNKGQILELSGLDFIQRAENIVLIGSSGTGKSGLAMGLLRQALLGEYRGRFYNAQDLMDELYASLADASSTKLLKRLATYDLLVIDELGYLTLKPEQANAFFKLMDQRYNRKSTIITTNLDYPEWYNLFHRKPLVDALLDRLQHHCITLRIEGGSLSAPRLNLTKPKLKTSCFQPKADNIHSHQKRTPATPTITSHKTLSIGYKSLPMRWVRFYGQKRVNSYERPSSNQYLTLCMQQHLQDLGNI